MGHQQNAGGKSRGTVLERASELGAEDDACELMTSFGKAVALDICREKTRERG